MTPLAQAGPHRGDLGFIVGSNLHADLLCLDLTGSLNTLSPFAVDNGEPGTQNSPGQWSLMVFASQLKGEGLQHTKKWLNTTVCSQGGIACWLVRVPHSWSKGCEFESRQKRWENFFVQSKLCVLTLIRCPFHPRVTTVGRKRPRSFCQKCRWQATPKHTYTFDPTESEWADYAAVQA